MSSGWWDSNDTSKEIKLLAYGMVIVAAIVWLTLSITLNRAIPTGWNVAFGILLGTAAAGIGIEAYKNIKLSSIVSSDKSEDETDVSKK